MEEMDKIKEQHPSICYGCELSRKPASDENTKKGWVGCCMRAMTNRMSGDGLGYDFHKINNAKEIGEGWVDLKSRVKIGKGSGVITNFQILTLGVESCELFEAEK